jgi:hypothetical protein
MMQLPPGFRKKTSAALPPEDEDVESYITEAATARGIPVEDALRVWSGEGKGAWQSNFRRRGKRERSYGPYQLYMDGGLGNKFQDETGLDPSDPSTWKQGVDYALDTAKKEGWKQWYGAPPELRERGGYVDLDSPSLGAIGRGVQLPPGFKKKGAAPARAYPNPSHGGDLTTDVEAPQPVLSWEETGRDVANSVVSNTIDAATYLAGLPGDAIEGAQWLDRNLGINSKGSDTPVDFASDDIRAGLKDKIGDWKYEPKTNAAKLAGYVPYVASGGVSALRNAGVGAFIPSARGVAQIAGGAMGAQAGEEIGGPVGEVVGLVAGSRLGAKPVPAGRAPRVTAADRAASEHNMVNTPGTEAVRRTSQQAYDQAEQMGIRVGGQPFQNLQTRLANDPVLHQLRMYPQNTPRLAATLDQITTSAIPNVTGRQGAVDLTLEEFDNLRRAALGSARSADPNERRMAGHLIDRLDDFFDNTVSRQYPGATEVMQTARNNWRIFRKSERIDQIMEVARDRAGQYSVSGNENAIRTGFRQLSTEINRNPRTRRLFTNDEIRLIRQLSRGRWTPRNALRIIGKLSPNVFSGTATVGGAGASYATGDPTYALLGAGAMGVGAASRGISGKLARNKVDELSNLIRSGGQMNRPNRTQPFVSGYLTARDEE